MNWISINFDKEWIVKEVEKNGVSYSIIEIPKHSQFHDYTFILKSKNLKLKVDGNFYASFPDTQEITLAKFKKGIQMKKNIYWHDLSLDFKKNSGKKNVIEKYINKIIINRKKYLNYDCLIISNTGYIKIIINRELKFYLYRNECLIKTFRKDELNILLEQASDVFDKNPYFLLINKNDDFTGNLQDIFTVLEFNIYGGIIQKVIESGLTIKTFQKLISLKVNSDLLSYLVLLSQNEKSMTINTFIRYLDIKKIKCSLFEIQILYTAFNELNTKKVIKERTMNINEMQK